jgi:hypothetical protein
MNIINYIITLPNNILGVGRTGKKYLCDCCVQFSPFDQNFRQFMKFGQLDENFFVARRIVRLRF